MPLDLRTYEQLPTDYKWVEQEETRIGEQALRSMQNAIYNTLSKVPVGQYFDIEKRVKPENHQVFVKTASEFIDLYPHFRFNKLMNRVYHDQQITLPLPKTTDNDKA